MLTKNRLFLIEGLVTLAVGISAIFLMPSSAVATKTWFRPNGWFDDREVGIVVNRVLRDDPTKGDMHNREGITPKSLLKSLSDYDMWPVSTFKRPPTVSYCIVVLTGIRSTLLVSFASFQWPLQTLTLHCRFATWASRR